MNTSAETSRRRAAAGFTGMLVILLGVSVAPTAGLAQVERISLDPYDGGRWPSISGDGRYLAFTAWDSGGEYAVLHDRTAGMARFVVRSGSGFARLSADGRYLAYSAFADYILRFVYVQDVQTGVSSIVSVSSDGVPASDSTDPSISADGRFVAFMSDAGNLVQGDIDHWWDVFVHDRDTGITELVSVNLAGIPGNANSVRPSISVDGYFVAFSSNASDLVANYTENGWDHIFVRDRRRGTTELVSVSSNGEQADSANRMGIESISADGERVVFASQARNLVPGDTNEAWDIFVRDRAAQTTRRVNVATGGAQANRSTCTQPSISADGRYVAFASDATNLVPGDSNRKIDFFIHDIETGQTTRHIEGIESCDAVSLSADGQIVAFSSEVSDLVPGDTNNASDVFVTRLGAPVKPPAYVRTLVALTDINGNGSPELAAVRTLADQRAEVFIVDSASAEAVGLVSFDESELALVDMATVQDISGEGYPELIALFGKPDGPAVVQVMDAATGNQVGRLHYFGKDWDVTAVTGIDRGRGGPEIAVLGTREDDLRGGIQIRFAEDDGTVDRTQFPLDAAREYRDIAVLEDITGDGQPELATLFTHPDGTGKVVIKDGMTKDWVNTYFFPGPDLGTATAIGVTGLGDLSRDGAPDIAVLFRKENGQGVVQLRDAGTGRWLHQMQFFGEDWYVVAVTSLDSNGDGVPDLAVLGVKDDGTAAGVQIRDASSGSALNWMSLPAGVVN